MESVKIIGWMLIISAIVMKYLISRRRFNRRGVGGLQHYPNFEKAVVTNTFEKIGKWLSTLMLIAGILILSMLWMDRKLVERNMEKAGQEQPISQD